MNNNLIGNLGGIRAFNTSNDKIGKWLEENGLTQCRDTLSSMGYTNLDEIRGLPPQVWITVAKLRATEAALATQQG